jgi:hypothetical protein
MPEFTKQSGFAACGVRRRAGPLVTVAAQQELGFRDQADTSLDSKDV